ncbi:MAG: hypothetical protein ABJC04_13920 [Verrucomicrobiota bacterium]
MKNKTLLYLAAGLLAVTVPQTTKAEDTKPAPPKSFEERRKLDEKLPPEERDAKQKELGEKRREEMKKNLKDLGLDPEELRKLSPEDRRAKIMEAAQKKVAELEKKKADGTLTAQEKETLGRLEARKKMMREHGETPGGRPHPLPEKPGDK